MNTENIYTASEINDLESHDFNNPTKVIVKSPANWHLNPIFLRTKNITGIHFEQPSQYVSSEDGRMVFEAKNDRAKLVLCLGADETVVIPESVKSIGVNSFDTGDTVIQRVEMSDGLQKIEPFAFWRCREIQEITLPESVRRVGIGSLASVKMIYVKKPVEGIIDAVVSATSKENISATFCIDYKGRKHIFPRNMKRYKTNKEKEILIDAEKILYDESYDEGVYGHIDFAQSVESKVKSAMEIFMHTKDENVKRCLKKHSMLIIYMTTDEAQMMEVLEFFHGGGILEEKELKLALRIATKNQWMLANAKVLEYLNERGGIKKSFVI